MKRTTTLPGRDDRGVSTPLSHVLSTGITTLLIIALVASATGFLDTQKERSANDEVRTIANRLAGELAKVDDLARDGDGVSVTTRHPERVAGSSYSVQLRHGAASCSAVPTDTCLEVSASGHDASAVVPVHNETDLALSSRGGGRFVLSAAAGSGTVQADQRRMELSPRVGIGQDVGTGPRVGVGTSLSQSPIPDFTFSPGVPQTNDPINFDGSPSEDPDGTVTGWEWDFDDDGTFEASGRTPSKIYGNAGTKNVTLRVTDDSGLTNTLRRQIDVSGLQYSGDMKVLAGNSDAVTFTVENKHSKPIEIERLLVDPEPSSFDELCEDRPSSGSDIDNEPHEVEVDRGDDGSPDGFVDWDGRFFCFFTPDIPEGGLIVDIDEDGHNQGGDVTLNAGDVARITVQDFPNSAVGEDFTFGVRYRIGSNVNSNVFNGTATTP